ncbi:MAG: serine protease, partial [Synechococcaceae bacterium WB7_3xG_012]|nr:serine protease [Synechococcaceae bacterium WB7_3xG_012]
MAGLLLAAGAGPVLLALPPVAAQSAPAPALTRQSFVAEA